MPLIPPCQETGLCLYQFLFKLLLKSSLKQVGLICLTVGLYALAGKVGHEVSCGNHSAPSVWKHGQMDAVSQLFSSFYSVFRTSAHRMVCPQSG